MCQIISLVFTLVCGYSAITKGLLRGYAVISNAEKTMKLNGVLLGSENARALAEFYTKVLGDPAWHDGDWYSFSTGADLAIGPHSEVKGQNDTPGRIMLMFEIEDVQHEFSRIKDLGAKVVAEPYHPGEAEDMWLATFADADGNYFQLSTPWAAPAE